MSGIRGRDTRIEVAVRKALFARGFRYRLNERKLPGRPDVVLPRYRATVFVNGCYWHGHDCGLFRVPSTNSEFWRAKIEGNRERDRRNGAALADAGWRVAVVWECALRGRGEDALRRVADRLARWLTGQRRTLEIPG